MNDCDDYALLSSLQMPLSSATMIWRKTRTESWQYFSGGKQKKFGYYLSSVFGPLFGFASIITCLDIIMDALVLIILVNA